MVYYRAKSLYESSEYSTQSPCHDCPLYQHPERVRARGGVCTCNGGACRGTCLGPTTSSP